MKLSAPVMPVSVLSRPAPVSTRESILTRLLRWW
jgi:hypothetical protein